MEPKMVNGNIPALISVIVGVTVGVITGEWGFGVIGFVLTLLPIILVLSALYGSPDTFVPIKKSSASQMLDDMANGSLNIGIYSRFGDMYRPSPPISISPDSGLPY